MELFQAVWYIFLFSFCLFAYLSFSAVTHDLLAYITGSDKRHAEEPYKLRPLTPLFESEEKLLAILQFCRLVFALPVILLVFEWGVRIHIVVAILVLIVVFPLLYLLPIRVETAQTFKVFRLTVQGISYILYPALWVIDYLSLPLVRHELKEEEKKKTNGEIEEVESEEFKGDIIKAVNTIEETTVREVMTPRVDMVTISASSTLVELHEFFKEHKFSRVPVYKELDNIVGIVGVMDFVNRIPETQLTVTVDTIMRPALFVPETKKVFTLLREFRESHAQMAIVIDEYGGTSGLVTLEDLLEELVGEIADEFDEAPEEAYREKDGAYVVTGKFPVERFEEAFGIQVVEEDFETISGLIFSIVGRIPLVGEIVKYQKLELEILEADKRRIHRVRIRQLSPAPENAGVAEI